MSKRKQRREPNLGGLYIPMGLFFGLGIGIFLGGRFVAPALFIGMGIGFYLFMTSTKRHHRKRVMMEELEFQEKVEFPKKLIAAVKPKQTPIPEQEVSPTYLESTLKSYRDTLRRIEKLTATIPSEKKVIISEIVYLLQKIDEYVQKDPSRYSAVKVFFQTYISSTETIIEKYALLMDQPVMNDDAVQSLRMIDGILVEMKAEYEETYSRLYAKDVTELQLEIANLRTKFKEEKVGKWL